MKNAVENPPSTEELLQQILKQNKLLHKKIKILDTRVKFMTYMGFIRFVLVLVPLILLLIYIPPIFSDVTDKYDYFMSLTAQDIARIFLNQFTQEEIRAIINDALLNSLR